MIILHKYNMQWFNKSSSEQRDAANQQQQFAQTLQGNYAQQFGAANASNQFLTQRLQQVFNQAQAGYGFSPAQTAALNTNNIEGQANATQQAQAETNRQIQIQGGGGGTTSGAAAQIAAQTARASANQGAANNRNIDIANATQANSNLAGAGSLLSGLSGQQAGLAGSTGGLAVSQSGAGFNAINQVYQPSNFWGNLGQGLLSGGLGAVGSAFGSAINPISLLKGGQSSGAPYQGSTLPSQGFAGLDF